MTKKEKVQKVADYLKLKAKNLFAILKISCSRFFDNHEFIIANGMAFKTIFAFVPVFAIFLAIFSMFPTFEGVKDKILQYIVKFILPAYTENIISYIENFLANTKFLSIVGILGVLYLSLNLFISLDNEINRIWSVTSKRTLLQKYLIYWALLTVTPFLLTGYFYYSGIVQSILFKITKTSKIGDFFIHFITIFLAEIFLLFLYYIIPNAKVKFTKAFTISVAVSLVWELLRVLFTYYMSIFIGNWTIYGSIAVFIFFMIWISFTWIILLFGVEVLNVWQNKLYIQSTIITRNFLFDIAYILLILSDFVKDFKEVGLGLTIEDFCEKYHADINDINNILRILESERIIISDNDPYNRRFFLRKDISQIKLSYIEKIVVKKMLGINYLQTQEFIRIINQLENYYFVHKEDLDVDIKNIIK